MNPLETYGLLSVGGAAGTCARYAVGVLAAQRLGAAFPWGTFAINVSGSFVIGLFLTAATADRVEIDPRWRVLVASGFCGGYTTFSSFTYETMKLFDAGSYWQAFGNAGGSLVAGLAAVFAGAALARWIW